MRVAAKTKYRPEQFRLQSFFKIYAPRLHIEMEYVIRFNVENQEYVKIADLADRTNKIAYFLNGESHSVLRDILNKDLIEKNTEWKVINCDKDSWEWNWLW